MEVQTVIVELERAGVTLAVEGGNLKLRSPAGYSLPPGLLAALRQEKQAALAYLRARENQPGQYRSAATHIPCDTAELKTGQDGWPPECLDYEQRCGQPHVRLFPFIGRKVRTPKGPGTLVQVFAERATVLLDSELGKCSFFAPGEIEPANWSL